MSVSPAHLAQAVQAPNAEPGDVEIACPDGGGAGGFRHRTGAPTQAVEDIEAQLAGELGARCEVGMGDGL
jgi:hypothetical protein